MTAVEYICHAPRPNRTVGPLAQEDDGAGRRAEAPTDKPHLYVVQTVTPCCVSFAAESVQRGLLRLWASTYGLQLLTQGYCWNAAGPDSLPLQERLQPRLALLGHHIHGLASRLRAFDQLVPARFDELAELSTIAPDDEVPPVQVMVDRLQQAYAVLIEDIEGLLGRAWQVQDEPTIELLREHLDAYRRWQEEG